MTTPDTPAKKVVKVEILHLDETGYGYDGTYTREEWRAACLRYFEAGADAFLAWQLSWQHIAEQNTSDANFDVERVFEDGSENEICRHKSKRHSLDFAGHTFFRGYVEPSGFVNARNCWFLYETHFHNATFTDVADFENANFEEKVNFSEATFEGNATFNGASFNNSDFRHACFSGCAEFHSNATFWDNVNFTKATFAKSAHFGEAKFLGYADFGGAAFTGDAYFKYGCFAGQAYFSNTTFTGFADFLEVNFESLVIFVKTKFYNQINFGYAKFKDATNFENAEFANVGHFENAKFNFPTSKIPSFRGVDIGSTRLDFSLDLQDDSVFSINYFDEESIKETIINIQFLKHLSEQHGQIDQALNFNAMELRAKRLQVIEQLKVKDLYWLESSFKCAYSGKWWVSCPTTWLYDKVSDFGRSFMRPLVGFIAIYGIAFSFAYCCAGVNNPQNCHDQQGREVWHVMLCDTHSNLADEAKLELNKADAKLPLNGYEAAFEYANYHATGLVDFTGDSKLKDAITQRVFGVSVKPWWARIIGALLSIINTALLFLIALGLRNSYRLK